MTKQTVVGIEVIVTIVSPDNVEVSVAAAPVVTSAPVSVPAAPVVTSIALAQQNEPAYLSDSFGAPTQAPERQAFPPFPALHCKDHPSAATRTVPGGVSKRTGKPYKSFLACSFEGCTWKADAA